MPKKGGVAKAHHAAVAHDEVQAHRRQREDHHAARETDVVGLVEPAGNPRQCRCGQQQQPGQGVASIHLTARRKEALRPEEQHGSHHEVDRDGRQRRSELRRNGIRQETV